MDFPPNIKLSASAKERLISYLNTEIQNHRAERTNWVEDLKNWQIDYWAEPVEKAKTFPFKNACNIVIPLTAIAVEAVHAREMTTLFALNQFVTLKLPPQYDSLTSDTEKTIDNILLKQCDFYKFCDTALLENKKLGTTVGKTGYEKIVKRAIRYQGGQELPFDVIVKQGPTADAVSLPNFLMPFVCNDPQLSPWCGEEHTKSPYEVKQLSEGGMFYPSVMKDLEGFISGGMETNISSAPYLDEVRKLQNQEPINWPNQISWFEIWLSFDVDDDGKDEEIVVHYHEQSQNFFSIRYNWYYDLHRPYRIGVYFPMEHRWSGIGIGKQNEQLQREVTTQNRQRIDNATLANLRMFKVKQGLGYGPNEPLFAGKIWEVENKDDVESFQMAEIYPSSYNNEQQAVVYSNQRTGVSELTLGMPQVGTPGTATSDLSRVQEAARKFDYTFKNSKRFVLEVVKDVLCNVSQFNAPNQRIYSVVTNGEAVKQLLSLPHDELKTVVLNDLGLAGQNANRLIDRNTWMQLAAPVQQYISGMLDLSNLLGNPQLSQLIAMRGIVAATEIMRQLLEAFDIRSIDKILVPLAGFGGGPQQALPPGPPAPQGQV
jgi:hypothetical protein